jgi:hypothetical protein
MVNFAKCDSQANKNNSPLNTQSCEFTVALNTQVRAFATNSPPTIILVAKGQFV